MNRRWILVGLTMAGLATALVASNPVSTSRSHIEGFTEPIRTVNVAAPESGLIERLHVRHGDRVKAGKTIAELERSVLQAQRSIANAKAESTARSDAAELRLQRAENRLRKLETLLKEGNGSVEEVAQAKLDRDLAKVEVASAADEAKINRLNLKRIDAELKRRAIRSPIDGVVTKLHHEAGEYISATDPAVVRIVQLDQLRVRFFPPTAVARRLRPGSTATVRFAESNRVVEGRVHSISPVTDASSATVRVDILLDNRNGKLRSGARCLLILK